MLVYRYMPYDFGFKTVESGWFAVQRPSRFSDMLEGNAGVGEYCCTCATAFDQLISVLCLNVVEGTSKESELLLWSLYADGHKGVRILVDLSESLLQSHFSSFIVQQVSYEERIPIIDPNQCISHLLKGASSNSWDLFSKILFHKYRAWKWENEIRILIENREINDFMCQKETPKWNGSCEKEKRWFFHFPYGLEIKGIDFGARIPECGWSGGVNLQRIVRDVADIKKVRPDLSLGIMQSASDGNGLERVDLDEYLKINRLI